LSNNTSEESHVLFVCIENSCRSQIAEALFNNLIENYEINASASSAGTIPADRVNPLTIQALEELNIHCNLNPKTLTREMMNDADVIVSMGCMAADFCPVPFLSKTQDWGIEAPSGQSLDDFREVRDVIKQKIEALIKFLYN